jgi:acetamidase/formamidase
MAGREFHLDPSKIHEKWNNALPPAITIRSGDVIHFETNEVSNGQVTPGCDASVLAHLDFDNIYPLAGPVGVEGANPGDVLQVDILELQPLDWGWTGMIPGLGLLPEDFPDPYIKHWDLSNGVSTELRPGITLPLDPFCGVMGVAPSEPGEIGILPPGRFGGNLDIRHLTKGNTLFLPVQVEGALFSAGDCHSAQGDGEVCVTGIESPMRFTLRFTLRKDLRIDEPRFICNGPLNRKVDERGYYCTTSVGPDLYKNSQNAIRYMIQHLVESYELTPEEAFVLCSVAVDLKISEIVDAPNWIVSAYLPMSIFEANIPGPGR